MLLFPWSPSTEAVSPFPETLTYFAMGVDRVCHGAWVDLTALQKGLLIFTVLSNKLTYSQNSVPKSVVGAGSPRPAHPLQC